MEETDPFLNTNPFAELGDDDDDNPSNDSTASNPTPQQQPLTANELELEAIRAQQRALLQETSTLLANPAEPFNDPSATMSGASTAPYVAFNNTGFAQQSEEKEETPPEQPEDQAFVDAQQGQTDFNRDAGPTAGAVPINQDLQLLLQAIQAQHRQLQSEMGDELRKLQAELSAVKVQQTSTSSLATPAAASSTALSAEDLSVQFNMNAGNNNASPGSVPGSTQPLVPPPNVLSPTTRNLELMLEHSLSQSKLQGEANQRATCAMVETVQQLATAQLKRDTRGSVTR